MVGPGKNVAPARRFNSPRKAGSQGIPGIAVAIAKALEQKVATPVGRPKNYSGKLPEFPKGDARDKVAASTARGACYSLRGLTRVDFKRPG